jgi:GT2 family glycosyltransferase
MIGMYKMSIVIPAHNRKAQLANALCALNQQKDVGRNDFEVVLVDDASTDNTREFIEGLNTNYDLKYIYLEKGEFPCLARTKNIGWQNASADIIAFLDSDMIVNAHYLKETLQCFDMDENIVLITTRLMLPAGSAIDAGEVTGGRIFEKYHYEKERKELFEIRHEVFNRMSYNMSMDDKSWLFVYGCSVALTKSSLVAVGGFDEKFIGWGMEDLDLAYKTHRRGMKAVYNYKMECLHQYHKESSRLNYKKNARYFLEKYPELSTDLPRNVIADMMDFDEVPEQQMTERALDECSRMKEEFGREKEPDTKVLPIHDAAAVTDAKAQVANALNNPDQVIVLLDFAEDSDLYIWVQLVSYGSKGKMLYFPMSRKPDIQELGR